MTTPAKPAKARPAWARSSPGSAPVEREALAWLRRHDQRACSFVDATRFVVKRRERRGEALASL